jgi:hypothetical protein
MKIKYTMGLASVLGVALLITLSGCVGYVDGPRQHERVYAAPSTVYVQADSGMEDDYVYYPGYQVYYSNHRHQYIYQEGHSWVTRPAPPRVSVDVLLTAPSVRLDFHDSPERHHSAVTRQYPRHWAPPGHERDQHENHGNGHHEDNQQ